MPLILKLNNNNSLYTDPDPISVQTGSVGDALRLGCSAIGYTIYPGSSRAGLMIEQLRELIEEARSVGLAAVVWSYPRGCQLSKEGETAIDVTAYAAQIAAQLGAHVIKVKLPSSHIEQDAARKVYEAEGIKIETLADRVRHVVQSSFDGKRIVIFSGGGKATDEVILEQVRAIPEAQQIAERFFSPRECANWKALAERERPQAFLRCWTRKEAYLKAIGEGLSRGLDTFDVSLAPGEPARLLSVAHCPREARRWSLHSLEPAPGSLAAVALAHPSCRARLRWWTQEDVP